MSASSKKKIRKEQESEMLTQRQKQEQKESKKQKLITTAFIAGLALILAIFIGVMIVDGINTSGVVGKWTTVATIGEHKLNLTDFNYYYVDAVNEFSSELYAGVSEYSEMYGISNNEDIEIRTGIDVTKPLTELIDEATGKPYADELVEKALNDAARDYALYDAAQKAGYKLPADEQEILNNMSTNIESYAMINRFVNSVTGETLTTLFLREGLGYGKYATVKSYIEYQERVMIADSYYQHYTEQLTYDDAELRTAEGENPENYNSYSYAYYSVKAEQFKTEENTDEEALAAAKTAAEELITATTIEEFDNKVAHLFVEETEEEVTEEETTEATEEAETVTNGEEEAITEDTTDSDEEIDIPLDTEEGAVEEENTDGDGHNHEHEAATKPGVTLHSNALAAFKEWLAKEDTVVGSTTVIEHKVDDKVVGYYAVYLTMKTDNNQKPSDVRHLLVNVAETKTEEDWAAALQTAEDLKAQWESGEKTEDSFAALVQEHTDDTGSQETGGLYENVTTGSSYVENFLSWCIDGSRKAGDVEIVKTEYGYHIMYFVKWHEDQLSYRDQLLTDNLRSADAQAWETGLVAAYTPAVKNTKKIDKDMVSFKQGY